MFCWKNVSSFCKSTHIFFSAKTLGYMPYLMIKIFNKLNRLTNHIITFEQLGPAWFENYKFTNADVFVFVNILSYKVFINH